MYTPLRPIRPGRMPGRPTRPIGAKKCYGSPPVCITTTDCDPLDPACVPTTISKKSALGHTAYHHTGLGDGLDVLWSPTARTIGSLAGAFHGYRRNKSIAWALVWSILGYASPPLTGAIALGQGFGKPKGA